MANEKLTYTTDFLTGKNETGKAAEQLTGKMNELSGRAKNFGSSITGSIAKFAGAAAIAVGGYKAVAFAIRSVEMAARSQENVTKLNNALKSAGEFSNETSRSLQRFATQIQRTTKFSDDAVISTLSYLRSLTQLSTKGLERTTKAATDLASATGKDLQTVTDALTKAANGQVGALSRLGITYKATGDKAKDFENVLAIIESRVGGRAVEDAKNYSGSLTILQSSFNDFRKSLGSFVTESDGLTALFGTIAKSFDSLTDSINESRESFNIFEESIIAIVRAVGFLGNNLLPQIELVFNALKLATVNAGQTLLTVLSNIAVKGLQVVNKIREFFGFEEIKSDIAGLIKMNELLSDSFSNQLFDFKISDGISRFSDEFERQLSGLQKKRSSTDKGSALVGREKESGATPLVKEEVAVVASQFDTLAASFIAALGKGADGAKESLAKGVGLIAGPVGEALTGLLSMSSDDLRAAINEFFDALPELIATIIENIPVLIEALVIGLVDALVILTEKADEIVEKLITGLIKAIPRIIEAFIRAVPRILETTFKRMAGILPRLFYDALKDSFAKLVDKLTGGAGDFFDGVGGFFGDVGSFIAKPFEDVGRAIKGIFGRSGGRNESFVSSANPNQSIIDAINGQGTSVIKTSLQLNQREFGNIILQLSRNNVRF